MILNDIPSISNFFKTAAQKILNYYIKTYLILCFTVLIKRVYGNLSASLQILIYLKRKKLFFTVSELIRACILLNFDTSWIKEQLIIQIFSFLSDLDMLKRIFLKKYYYPK